MRALPAVFMLAGYLTIAPVAHAEDPLQATQAMIQQQIQARRAAADALP